MGYTVLQLFNATIYSICNVILFIKFSHFYSSNFRILPSETSMPSILRLMIKNWIDVNWIMLVTLTCTSPCSCFTVAWLVTLLYFLYLCKLHWTVLTVLTVPTVLTVLTVPTVLTTQAGTSVLRLFTLRSTPNVICYYYIYVFAFVVCLWT